MYRRIYSSQSSSNSSSVALLLSDCASSSIDTILALAALSAPQLSNSDKTGGPGGQVNNLAEKSCVSVTASLTKGILLTLLRLRERERERKDSVSLSLIYRRERERVRLFIRSSSLQILDERERASFEGPEISDGHPDAGAGPFSPDASVVEPPAVFAVHLHQTWRSDSPVVPPALPRRLKYGGAPSTPPISQSVRRLRHPDAPPAVRRHPLVRHYVAAAARHDGAPARDAALVEFSGRPAAQHLPKLDPVDAVIGPGDPDGEFLFLRVERVVVHPEIAGGVEDDPRRRQRRGIPVPGLFRVDQRAGVVLPLDPGPVPAVLTNGQSRQPPGWRSVDVAGVVHPVKGGGAVDLGAGHGDDLARAQPPCVERPPVVAAPDNEGFPLPVDTVGRRGQAHAFPGGAISAAVVPEEPPFALVAYVPLHHGRPHLLGVPASDITHLEHETFLLGRRRFNGARRRPPLRGGVEAPQEGRAASSSAPSFGGLPESSCGRRERQCPGRRRKIARRREGSAHCCRRLRVGGVGERAGEDMWLVSGE